MTKIPQSGTRAARPGDEPLAQQRTKVTASGKIRGRPLKGYEHDPVQDMPPLPPSRHVRTLPTGPMWEKMTDEKRAERLRCVLDMHAIRAEGQRGYASKVREELASWGIEIDLDSVKRDLTRRRTEIRLRQERAAKEQRDNERMKRRWRANAEVT